MCVCAAHFFFVWENRYPRLLLPYALFYILFCALSPSHTVPSFPRLRFFTYFPHYRLQLVIFYRRWCNAPALMIIFPKFFFFPFLPRKFIIAFMAHFSHSLSHLTRIKWEKNFKCYEQKNLTFSQIIIFIIVVSLSGQHNEF